MVTIVVPTVSPAILADRPSRVAAPRRRAPNAAIRAATQAYNRLQGLPPLAEDHYVRVDETVACAIADAYDRLPDVDRDDPAVAIAYDAFRSEIAAQWHFASNDLGFRFEAWVRPGQPYADSQQMTDDLRRNRRLFFFTGGEPHPYLGVVDPATGLTPNDQFRAVHDFFGHAAEGYGFGPRGEENAWLKHSQMFTAAAQRAMTTETRGQNAWVNFGRHNYDALGRPLRIPPAGRPYAKQKVALLPLADCDWHRVLSAS